MIICELCQRGFQQAGGESLEVPGEVVAMACCDAQHIGRLGAGGGAVSATAAAAAKMRTESHVGADARIGASEHSEQWLPVLAGAPKRRARSRASPPPPSWAGSGGTRRFASRKLVASAPQNYGSAQHREPLFVPCLRSVVVVLGEAERAGEPAKHVRLRARDDAVFRR